MCRKQKSRQDTRQAGSGSPAVILWAVFLMHCAAFSAGCVSASASQSVQDWNAWSALQQKFSGQAGATLETLDSHHAILNTAIANGKTDFASLRSNISTDRENLDLWKPQLLALDAAATRFYANATPLNGTARGPAQRMIANIDVYLLNMNAARGELTSYCTNLDAYLGESDLDYADDARRTAADAARERALLYLKQADDALVALDADAAALGRAQTVI